MIKVALGLDVNDLKRGMREFDKTFKSMASVAQTALGTIGIGLSAAATVQFLHSTAAELDAIGKAARRASVNTDDYQVLAEAFRMGAGSAEELSMSLTKVQQLMGMAGRGDERATEIFGRMGVDFRDLAGMAPDKLLETISKRIMEIKDGNERTTAAVEIFGEKGMKTVEILAAGLSNLKSEMERTGRIYGPDAIKDAEDYNDALTEINRTWKSIIVSMGVAKGMSGLAKQIKGAMEGNRELPLETAKAQQAGASGIYASHWQNQSLTLGDYFSLGFFSDIWGKSVPANVPLISVPANPNLVEQQQRYEASPDYKNKQLEKGMERSVTQAIAEQKRLEELAKRQALAAAAIDKMLAPLKFVKEEDVQALTDETAAAKMLPDIYKAVAATGYQMTEQDKEAIKNRVKLTYETLRAAQAQEKFEKSLKSTLQPMREQLLTSLGMGRYAEYDRAQRELRAAKGRPLTVDEQKQAAELGDLRYRMGQIGVNRQQFDTSIRSNELSEMGGNYQLVVTPDADSITAGIAEDTAAMREILDQIQQQLNKLGVVGG